MVKKRAFSSAVVVNSNKVLVIGGRENENDSGILDCCETFDLVTGQWNLEPARLRTARCAAGICKVADKVFVFGGESEDDALIVWSVGMLKSVSGPLSLTCLSALFTCKLRFFVFPKPSL